MFDRICGLESAPGLLVITEHCIHIINGFSVKLNTNHLMNQTNDIKNNDTNTIANGISTNNNKRLFDTYIQLPDYYTGKLT